MRVGLQYNYFKWFKFVIYIYIYIYIIFNFIYIYTDELMSHKVVILYILMESFVTNVCNFITKINLELSFFIV